MGHVPARKPAPPAPDPPPPPPFSRVPRRYARSADEVIADAQASYVADRIGLEELERAIDDALSIADSAAQQ